MGKVIKPPTAARTAHFRTLERESRFQNPPKDKSAYPLLYEAVQPHIGSFNALTEGPEGGLLNQGIKDIGEKVIFDGKRSDSIQLGNRPVSYTHLTLPTTERV